MDAVLLAISDEVVGEPDSIRIKKDSDDMTKFLKKRGLEFRNFHSNTNIESLPATINNAFNQIQPSVLSHVKDVPLSLLVYYTGHGSKTNLRMPKPGESVSAVVPSGVPRIFINDQFYEVRREMFPATNGSWLLHDFGLLSPQFYLHYVQKTLIESKCTNKEVVIISDSCYSAEWSKALQNYSSNLGNNCHITVQSTAVEEAAGGLFVPIFLAIQDEQLRKAWLKEYELLTPAKKAILGKDLQEVALTSTNNLGKVLVYQVNNFGGTNKSSLWLFNSNNFFWFCAENYFSQFHFPTKPNNWALVHGRNDADFRKELAQKPKKWKLKAGKLVRSGNKILIIYWFENVRSDIDRQLQVAHREIEMHLHYTGSFPPKLPVGIGDVDRVNIFQFDHVNQVCDHANGVSWTPGNDEKMIYGSWLSTFKGTHQNPASYQFRHEAARGLDGRKFTDMVKSSVLNRQKVHSWSTSKAAHLINVHTYLEADFRQQLKKIGTRNLNVNEAMVSAFYQSLSADDRDKFLQDSANGFKKFNVFLEHIGNRKLQKPINLAGFKDRFQEAHDVNTKSNNNNNLSPADRKSEEVQTAINIS